MTKAGGLHYQVWYFCEKIQNPSKVSLVFTIKWCMIHWIIEETPTELQSRESQEAVTLYGFCSFILLFCSFILKLFIKDSLKSHISSHYQCHLIVLI